MQQRQALLPPSATPHSPTKTLTSTHPHPYPSQSGMAHPHGLTKISKTFHRAALAAFPTAADLLLVVLVVLTGLDLPVVLLMGWEAVQRVPC